MCLLHLRGQGCSRQMGLALSVLPIIIFLTSSSSCRLLACFTDYHQWLTGGTLLNNGKQVHEKHTTVCSLSRWPKQKGSLIFVSTLYLLLCKVTLVFQLEDTVRIFGTLLLLDPIHFPKSEPCLIIGSVCQSGALLKHGTHSHNLSWNILVNMQREIQIPLWFQYAWNMLT